MTRTKLCELCMENWGDRWTLTILLSNACNSQNNHSEYPSLILFLFSSVHFIDCIFYVDDGWIYFLSFKIKDDAMFLQVLIWKLNWKPLSAFRTFLWLLLKRPAMNHPDIIDLIPLSLSFSFQSILMTLPDSRDFFSACWVYIDQWEARIRTTYQSELSLRTSLIWMWSA